MSQNHEEEICIGYDESKALLLNLLRATTNSYECTKEFLRSYAKNSIQFYDLCLLIHQAQPLENHRFCSLHEGSYNCDQEHLSSWFSVSRQDDCSKVHRSAANWWTVPDCIQPDFANEIGHKFNLFKTHHEIFRDAEELYDRELEALIRDDLCQVFNL